MAEGKNFHRQMVLLRQSFCIDGSIGENLTVALINSVCKHRGTFCGFLMKIRNIEQ